MSKPTPISAILSRLLKGYGLEWAMAEHLIAQKWKEIAGDPIAAHTRPDRLRSRVLYIIVDSPTWRHQLSFLREELIRKVNHALSASGGKPLITDVRFHLGELPEKDLPG